MVLVLSQSYTIPSICLHDSLLHHACPPPPLHHGGGIPVRPSGISKWRTETRPVKPLHILASYPATFTPPPHPCTCLSLLNPTSASTSSLHHWEAELRLFRFPLFSMWNTRKKPAHYLCNDVRLEVASYPPLCFNILRMNATAEAFCFTSCPWYNNPTERAVFARPPRSKGFHGVT